MELEASLASEDERSPVMSSESDNVALVAAEPLWGSPHMPQYGIASVLQIYTFSVMISYELIR